MEGCPDFEGEEEAIGFPSLSYEITKFGKKKCPEDKVVHSSSTCSALLECLRINRIKRC